MGPFDAKSLPEAIANLFRVNNYTVEGPMQIHGAEIDLVATPIGDPFAAPVYIEATIEHVDNDKYGKDIGKLAMIGQQVPNARKLIVSSRGFSLPVKERAKATGIDVLTYAELFSLFERFEPYVKHILEGPQSEELRSLDDVYEEANFADQHGTDIATDWLTHWATESSNTNPWLILVGEYGTGKTALTKVLQRRWLQAYRANPGLPIPFRIELRDFTRQFDAAGLLHHFLDHNRLGHIPIEFVWSLIRSRRVVLLLDGYDEMAQYLSARERRVCLEALAHLSAGGAKGLLSSRPNYFSEAEEFHLFEVLYRSIDARSPLSTKNVEALAVNEQQLDEFIENQFLNRYERALQDLTPEQTEELVGRILAHDADGAQAIIDILRRVFRSSNEGAAVSLSGKPVIITYLLDLVDQLKDHVHNQRSGTLTEWDVYTLVVDQLMLRDYGQVQRIMPVRRRKFLQKLALWLTQKGNTVIDEGSFRELIQHEFRQELRRYDSGQRRVEIENLFEDLRRSGTLTRSADANRQGWRFSHNSLREFLLAELLLDGLDSGAISSTQVPVSDAMRLFATSQPKERLEALTNKLAGAWRDRANNRGIGQLLVLLWDGILVLNSDSPQQALATIPSSASGHPSFDKVSLARLQFSSIEWPTDMTASDFSGSELSNIDFAGANLTMSRFDDCLLDGVDFTDADLTDTNFVNSALMDVNLSGADVTGADFRLIDSSSSILIDNVDKTARLRNIAGQDAIGYLNFSGAVTDSVSDYAILQHHPKFDIVEKVCAKFNEHSPRQRLGIVQKGAAARDVGFAKEFVGHLEASGLIEVKGGRPDVLYVTSAGRNVFAKICNASEMPKIVADFLRLSQ